MIREMKWIKEKEREWGWQSEAGVLYEALHSIALQVVSSDLIPSKRMQAHLLMRLMMVLSAWKSGRSAGSSAQHLLTVVTSSSLLQPSPYSSASPRVGLINVGRNGTDTCPFFTSLYISDRQQHIASIVTQSPSSQVSTFCHCQCQLLNVTRYRFNTFGRRAFAVACPTAWNFLPDYIRQRDNSTLTVSCLH